MGLLELVSASSVAERLNVKDFNIYARSTRSGSSENNPADDQMESEMAQQIVKTGVLKSAQSRVEMIVSDLLEGLSNEQIDTVLTEERRETASGIISDLAVVGMRRSRTLSSAVRDAGGDEDANSLERTANAALEQLINSIEGSVALVRVTPTSQSSRRNSISLKNTHTF
jgi:hypothetical protein